MIHTQCHAGANADSGRSRRRLADTRRAGYTLTTQRVIPPLEEEFRLEPDEERDSSPRIAGLNNQPTHSLSQRCTVSRNRTVAETTST